MMSLLFGFKEDINFPEFAKVFHHSTEDLRLWRGFFFVFLKLFLGFFLFVVSCCLWLFFVLVFFSFVLF